ncbi:beta-ketoacyl synthase chain length factor [Photobacterium damselae]|uniref:beta-ketoacyl synthase chain length factor n=1 Tax=Photobacterium damselae TaxID=38293 RepID=UPI0040675963
MPNSKIKISFNIDAWSANSFGLTSLEQWKEWASTTQWPKDSHFIVADIPPMMRRRMSQLSKLAVQTAIELLKQHNVDYLVFSSRHGELHRSTSLIENIINDDEASPMAFSQSVHNTAAGLATIATKCPIPLTSIAASDNTFQSALIEAWLFLNEHPDKKVLLVDFDEPLPEPYSAFEEHTYQGFGLGLVLSHGDELTITAIKSGTLADSLPQGLCFVKHFLSSANQWTIHSPQQDWEWRRQ